jgi:membrane associated rhomboid family serine protease
MRKIAEVFSYESKVVLIFSLIAVLVWVMSLFSKDVLANFMTGPDLLPISFFKLFKMFSHVFGHSNFSHLFSNLLLIILLGGIIEKKYGSEKLVTMILLTSLMIGLTNALIPFFSGYILGASGIVFMFIGLTPSLLDRNDGKIPIEYLLVALMFGGREVYSAFNNDNISQLAHLVGIGCGVLFGFLFSRLSSQKRNISAF